MSKTRASIGRMACLAIGVAIGTGPVSHAAITYLSTAETIEAGDTQSWPAVNDLYVGNSGVDGLLTIQQGGKAVNVKGYIGTSVNSSGRVIVDGENSVWTNTGSLSVGYSSTGSSAGAMNRSGRLQILDGGKVYMRSSSGTYIGHNQNSTWGPANGFITVDGAGSELFCGSEGGTPYSMVVGNSGNGTLTVTNGGKVTCNIMTVGGNTSASAFNTMGIVTIVGSGSRLTTSQINLGHKYSSGKLTVDAGGVVTSGYIRAGQSAGLGGGDTGLGQITVRGSQSRLHAQVSGTHSMIIGGYDTTAPGGVGLIELLDGGRLTTEKIVQVYGNSTLRFELGSWSGTAPFQVGTTMDLLDGATIAVTLTPGFTPDINTPYTLVGTVTALNTDVDDLVLDLTAEPRFQQGYLVQTTTALQIVFPPSGGTTIMVR